MSNYFKNKTTVYGEGRTGYSDEAINLISKTVTAPQSVIADIGSGTGILSEALLKRGYGVYCVEPDAALQQKAKERLNRFNGFTAVDAAAEDTNIMDKSIDGITVASAFHWFSPEAFLSECKRIMKPEGHVFLIYNIRQSEDEFSRKQECICHKYCKNFTSFHHGADKAKSYCSKFFSDRYNEKIFSHDLVYTKQQFLSRSLSSSYSPNQNQKDYFNYRQELEKLITEYSSDKFINIHNYTVVWYGTLK